MIQTVLSVLAMVVLPVLIAEFMDWCPWLAIRLVRWSARRLNDQESRARYEEEWVATIEAVPGKLAPLVTAIGCVIHLPLMLWVLRHVRYSFNVELQIDSRGVPISFGRFVPLSGRLIGALAATAVFGWLILFLPISGPTTALGDGAIIGTADLPPGFVLDARQSGPYERPLIPSWLSPIMRHAVHIRGYDRVWFHRQERRAIIAQVAEYPSGKMASTEAYSAAKDFKGKEFTITGVPYAHGFVVRYGTSMAAQCIFTHGPHAFSIVVLTRTAPSEADIELIDRLVRTQAGKAPPGSSKFQFRYIGELCLAVGIAFMIRRRYWRITRRRRGVLS